MGFTPAMLLLLPGKHAPPPLLPLPPHRRCRHPHRPSWCVGPTGQPVALPATCLSQPASLPRSQPPAPTSQPDPGWCHRQGPTPSKEEVRTKRKTRKSPAPTTRSTGSWTASHTHRHQPLPGPPTRSSPRPRPGPPTPRPPPHLQVGPPPTCSPKNLVCWFLDCSRIASTRVQASGCSCTFFSTASAATRCRQAGRQTGGRAFRTASAATRCRQAGGRAGRAGGNAGRQAGGHVGGWAGDQAGGVVVGCGGGWGGWARRVGRGGQTACLAAPTQGAGMC